MNHTPASLAQRLANIEAANNRRRTAETCQRGHSNWARRKNGRRFCRTCKNDRAYYYRHGFGMVAVSGNK